MNIRSDPYPDHDSERHTLVCPSSCRTIVTAGLQPAAALVGEYGSVQPQVGDVPGIRVELAALDAQHDIGQRRVGSALQADLLAFAHHEAVEEGDLGAPALLHVLAHGRTLLGGDALAVG